MAPPVLPEYLWMVIVGGLVSVGFGFGTGANDVANAFATSVGAKTLTLFQAVMIAIVFEFVGALLLGRVITSTIAGGIASIATFEKPPGPEIYAYGMIAALTMGFLWQWWASSKGLNVSATHSIIAGIMGFSLVYGGPKAVNWASPDPGAFPPYKGVLPIILSWFISPVLTGAVSATLFFTLRTLVLRRSNAAMLSLFVLPLAVFITFFINIYFVFTKGAKKMLAARPEHDWSDGKSAWISALCALGVALLTAVIIVPILIARSKKFFDADGNSIPQPPTAREQRAAQRKLDAEAAETAAAKGRADGGNASAGEVLARLSAQQRSAGQEAKTSLGQAWRWIKHVTTQGMTTDIHHAIEDDPLVAAMHERAEKFEPRVEFAFGYLQVFSAICVIFAHGANEVGYMAGPMTTIYQVYQTGKLPKNVAAPIWIVALSAAGLVLGLATYGHIVCAAMGVSLAKLSPTRGFCAELATALVITIAAQSGLPTSSSQCIIGGIMGVGLLEGMKGGVNWRLFGFQFASWVTTMFVCAAGSAAITAQGMYTPNRFPGRGAVSG